MEDVKSIIQNLKELNLSVNPYFNYFQILNVIQIYKSDHSYPTFQ